MGYTHYWKRDKKVRAEVWASLVGHALVIFEFCEGEGIPLVDGRGNAGSSPHADLDIIAFNGVEDEAHETFMMSRDMTADGGFCKTAYKPYDLAVCMMLISAKKVLGDAIVVTSDGDALEWKEAFDSAQRVLSIKAGFMASKRDPHGNPTEWTVEVD